MSCTRRVTRDSGHPTTREHWPKTGAQLASSRRVVAAAALLAVSVAVLGCVTGHLFDAGRLQERVERYDYAYIDGDRLHLRYRARIEDADGEVVERVSRVASLSLAALRTCPALPVDAIRVDWGSTEAPCRGACRAVALAPAQHADVSTAPSAWVEPPSLLVLQDENGEAVSLYTGTLARQHTAGWVYGVLPFSLAADAVATVPLVVFAIPYLFFD